MTRLTELEGIGEAYAAKLEMAGIISTDSLLERACARHGRKDVAKLTGISEKLIGRWVNRADLFRIRGVSSEYADLLEFAGVDTVLELAQRCPDNLQAKMVEINAVKQLVRQVPSISEVEDWVIQAQNLPRRISH